jgi:hypothetical protein
MYPDAFLSVYCHNQYKNRNGNENHDGKLHVANDGTEDDNNDENSNNTIHRRRRQDFISSWRQRQIQVVLPDEESNIISRHLVWKKNKLVSRLTLGHRR